MGSRGRRAGRGKRLEGRGGEESLGTLEIRIDLGQKTRERG